jgi:hypothetical protein
VVAARRQARLRGPLPLALRSLFWDLPADRLTFARDRDLIVGRVLAHGGWREAKVLRRRIGDEGIREWVLRQDARGLSPAQVRFWELILDLPKKKADAWVRSARASLWERRQFGERRPRR